MVALVSELERAGFVRRSPDPSDGRRKLVGLTPAGVFALRQLDAHVSEAEDDLLRPLSPPERDQLERLLTRLVEHHSRTTQP
jgi:DNA-binding MarR family transcriptional regulator